MEIERQGLLAEAQRLLSIAPVQGNLLACYQAARRHEQVYEEGVYWMRRAMALAQMVLDVEGNGHERG